MFIDGVNSCPSLLIKFPTTNKEKQAVMNIFNFKKRSTTISLMHWCYRCWLLTAYHQTKKNVLWWWVPSSILVWLLYFVWNNVLAVCDDSNYCSYNLVLWHQKNVQIRRHSKEHSQSSAWTIYYRWCFSTMADQVFCPFVGSQRESSSKDAFSYFLSQLGIRIEMKSGLLAQQKWSILQVAVILLI